MSKYIIKNCPAFAKGIFCKGGDIIDDGCADKTLDRNTLISCQDCTDCLLKQIVELAKEYKEELIDRKTKKVVATRYFKLTKEILEPLDIQEVE